MTDKPPIVILLHGLGRRASAMATMAHALEAEGFETWSTDYPSTTTPIDKIARRIARQIRGRFPKRQLHAVTHSLGGIVFRHLKDDRLDWKRAVLIAPPNQGSAVAMALAHNPMFHLLAGPAGGALAGATKVSHPWPFPPCPFGIIAGTKQKALLNPTSWISHRIFDPATEHDGTVAVEETKLEGMAGFVTVDATHTTITDDPQVQTLAIKFLKGGVFE